MPRTCIYRLPARGPRGVGYRIDLLPAESLSGISRPLPSVPTIIDVPDGIIELLDAPEWGYDSDFPSGVIKIAPWKFRVDFGRCEGTADLENLRTILQEYKIAGGGGFYLGGSLVSFDLYNVMRIYSDRGSMGATWSIIYEGEQRQDPEPEVEIQIGRGSAVVYQLHHLAETVPQKIRMDWISQMSSGFSTDAPWNSLNSDVADLWWEYSGARFHWLQSVRGSFGPPPFRARFERMATVWIIAQRLLSTFYHAAIRSSEPGWWVTGTYHFTISSPYALWLFNRQDETTPGELGDPLDDDEIAIMGDIVDPSGTPVLGLFQPGKDSLRAFGDLGTFIAACADACIARQTIITATPNRLVIGFTASASTSGPSAELDYTAADLRVDRGKSSIKGKLAAHNVSEIQVSAQDVRGGDEGNWKTTLDGSGTKRITSKLLWDINPLRLNSDDWAQSTIGGLSTGWSTNTLCPWKLYYWDNPWGSAGAYPTRVHHVAGYRRDGSVLLYPNSGWPTYSTVGTTDRDGQRDIIAVLQETCGMQATMSAEYTRFNDLLQTLMDAAFAWPNQVDGSIVTTDQIGSLLRLTPADADGTYTLNTLLRAGDTYQRGYGRSVMVRGKIDPKSGKLITKQFGVVG